MEAALRDHCTAALRDHCATALRDHCATALGDHFDVAASLAALVAGSRDHGITR
jgi:hypothetical protein